MAYIYKITNDINDKIYIGKTELSIQKRFKEHCRDALRYYTENRPLYKAMHKYGIEHFQVELVEETDDPENREIYWINYYDSFNNGYNATLGGDGKRKINYDAIIETYQIVQNITKTAQQYNIDFKTVKNILKNSHIEINHNGNSIIQQNYGKSCDMIDKTTNIIIQTFPSCRAAGEYLKAQQISQDTIDHLGSRIGQVCNKKRKSAYGYYWQWHN